MAGCVLRTEAAKVGAYSQVRCRDIFDRVSIDGETSQLDETAALQKITQYSLESDA